MRGWVKVVIGVSVGLVALLAVPVIGIGSAFIGLAPLPEQVTDLGEGVTLVPDSYVSAYIIEAGPGTFALIDCGMSVEGNAVAAALGARGVGVDAVRAVFLTHGHGDHADGCRAFPRADVYAMQADIDLTEGRVAPPSPVGRLAGKMDSGTRVTHPLKDGDVVRVGDTDIRVYGTPGHTDGSAVYTTHGVVFFGDSASATTSGTIQGAPWFFSNDTAQNVKAVAALDARLTKDAVPMRKLAFSHTGPLDGAEELHAFAAAH